MNAAHVVMVALGVPGLVMLIALVTWTVTPFAAVRVDPPRLPAAGQRCQRDLHHLMVNLREWSKSNAG